MKRSKILLLLSIIFLIISGGLAFAIAQSEDDHFISYTVDVKKQYLKFYWKDDSNTNFRSIQNLKLWLEKRKRKLVFAMNGGMYKPDNSPQGLFIEKQTTL